MSVHLEGFGWLGSALAVEFDRRGVDFTWSDTDRDHVAWRASTGAVYPAGDPRSQRDLAEWGRWIDEQRFEADSAGHADLWYTQKSPPHGGPPCDVDAGFARRSSAKAITVNVARVVLDTRARFADLERPARPDEARRIVAHGWGTRLDKVLWGWSRRVSVVHPFDGPLRPVILVRRHRFLSGYLYPVPGTVEWWAGSAMIPQDTPRRLNPEVHEARWLDLIARDAPWLEVEPVGPLLQGWRPKPKDADEPHVSVTLDGTVVVPPLSHSGVRWAPGVVREVMEAL